MDENQEKSKPTIDDKLFKVKYVPDEESHLKADNKICLLCTSKVCTYICPAHVYEWDEENKKLLIGHENCLECGACRIVCPSKNIDWEYPKGIKGVTFKNG
ncbi:MAG TPA: 4Fe-4S dicluster domain-containing protein [Candidatus Gastranaerophilaceae bacterium]|nr:4Fe-4S dicluster domain-containing protein [Candidatus Gastranaerophilaceae bacterium]HPT41898.1 4Fe-4S dicluster domain-containing protein [Candidatus Gastranaerophilaceae bacterium]